MDKIQALRVFAKAAATKSFSTTADQLNLSAPMVSRSIAALEGSIGARLFNRTTRSITLTEAGTTYLRHITSILSALDEADTLVQQREEVKGTLRISAPASLGESQLMKLIIQFMKKHPAVRIELNLDNRRINLVEENYDLAIRITHEVEPSLIARKLCVCNTVLCAAPAYLAKYGHPASLQELATRECLIFPNFQRQAWQFKRENQVEEIEVNGRLQINNIDALVKAAIAGMGITHQPTFMVSELIQKRKLEVVTIPNYVFLSPTIYAVYPSREYLPYKVRAFIEALIEWVTPIPTWDKKIKA
jgi:DNA-binding transcriptional LysR family regulator